MKKKYKLQNLDCANCASKLEDAIKKIDGINDAAVSFMTQKLMIEAEDSLFESKLEEVEQLISRMIPDCKIVFK